LDATLIEAKTPNRNLRSKALVNQLKKKAATYLDKLNWQETDIDQKLSPKAKVNKLLVSPKDSDAQITTQKNQKSRLAYKGHITVDGGKARIVTALKLTGGAYPEEHLLWQLSCRHELATKVPLKYLSADTRYSTIDNLRFLKAKGILPAIPTRKGGRLPSGGFKRDLFNYNTAADKFICPNKKELLPASPVGKWKTYRSKKSDCTCCALNTKCLSPKAKRRTIMVNTAESIVQWAMLMLKTPMAKKLLKKRKVYPETIFANAKTFHGLNKAKFKGRWKVEIQALMTFAAINLKKLVKYADNKTSSPAQQLRTTLKPLLLSPMVVYF